MPAPTIDRTLIQHIAQLSSLSLCDADVDRFASELRRIVGYIEQLDSLDTRDVPPTANVSVDRAPGRPDEVAPGLNRDEVLAQAPEVESDGFAVPAFVE
jgi:aspartyl-tRNA(Asn)/glutamyl-tRNA(Gln) amidotransferase subunit C